MKVHDQHSSVHPLSAPVNSPAKDTWPSELHHSDNNTLVIMIDTLLASSGDDNSGQGLGSNKVSGCAESNVQSGLMHCGRARPVSKPGSREDAKKQHRQSFRRP